MKVYEIVDLFEDQFLIEDQDGEPLYCGSLTVPAEHDFKLTYELLYSDIIKLGSCWELPAIYINKEESRGDNIQ